MFVHLRIGFKCKNFKTRSAPFMEPFIVVHKIIQGLLRTHFWYNKGERVSLMPTILKLFTLASVQQNIAIKYWHKVLL